MSEPGYAQARFTRYIRQAKRRETWRLLLVFLLCVVAGLIAVTAIGSLLGIYRGFSDTFTTGVRAALFATLAMCVIFLLWRPISRLSSDGGASLIESSDAAFNGRVQTFVDTCLLYTSPSPRDRTRSRMPSSA